MRRPAEALLLAALLVAGLLPAAPVGAQRTVREVELRSDVSVKDPEIVRELIPLQPGDELTEEAVQRALRNLHALGVAGEVEAYRRPAGDRVDAVFVLRGNVLVDEIRLQGELGLRQERLRQAVEQRPGGPLVEGQLLRSLYALQDLYQARGYLEATVRLEVLLDEERKRATVTFRIDSGPPARIGEVRFQGELGPFSPPELREQLQHPPESRYLPARVEEDAESLERWLIGEGYRLATVRKPRADYSPETGLVTVEYRLEVGPPVEVEILGADREELKKRDLLPFLGPLGYDEGRVLLAARRITTHYQEKGHYEVEVEWEQERSPEAIRVRMEVRPGPVYRLEEIRFQGNQEVSREQLEALMGTSSRRSLTGGAPRLVDEVLEEDLDNIRSYYALQGFGEARVGPPDVTVRPQGLGLTIPVEEGPRRQVRRVDFEGVSALEMAELRRAVPLKDGGPYHSLLLDQSLDAIRSAYSAQAYDDAYVATDLAWDREERWVVVTFQVLEGPQARVDRVIVRGNRRTRTQAIKKWVGLEPGDRVGARQLLEIERTLYRLGIFSEVEVRSAPTLTAAGRDVIVRVVEGDNRRMSYGLGFDSEDGVRGSFGYGWSNLFGRAVRADLNLTLAQEENQFRFLLRKPYAGAFHVPLTFSIFQAEEKRESFDSRTRGAQLELVRSLERVRLSLLYSFDIVETENVDPSLGILEADPELKEVEVSSISPGVLYDRRDHPVDPTRGYSSLLQAEYAFPLFAAETSFIELFNQETGYKGLGAAGYLAGSFRIGAIEPLGDNLQDPTVPGELPAREVPIVERYFAGGISTHRAYRRDRLGIPGETTLDGVPIGGTGLLLLNLEYRFPIRGPFWGTLFVDSGNVWGDWRDISPSDFKNGLGVGLRYSSPLGPVRVEIGWKLDREAGEDPAVVLLSFGNPF